MKFLLFRSVFILLICVSISEAESRVWTSKKGTEIEAELVKRQGDRVSLVSEKGRKLTVKIADLSEEDQLFLEELLIKEAGSKISGIDAEPGKISGVIQCARSKWTYHVYLPKKFHLGRQWPVWFIMSPEGGVGGSMMKRYIKGAERAGCILVGSVESNNKFQQSQTAMESMADDVYKRFPVEAKFAFASGFSGGSRQAYLLAETNRHIAGILACGSGGGVYPEGEGFRESKLKKKICVYSLIGTNCFNRPGSYKTHKGLKDQYRLRFFLGSHDWANAELIEQGMLHVMGQALLVNKSLDSYKEDCQLSLKNLAEMLKEDQPWESYHLATLGNQLDSNYDKGYFGELLNELTVDPKVKLALKAEDDIEKLCSMFYIKYNSSTGDRKDVAKRTKKGEELSLLYSEIPHGALLKRLGQKSNAP